MLLLSFVITLLSPGVPEFRLLYGWHFCIKVDVLGLRRAETSLQCRKALLLSPGVSEFRLLVYA